MSRSSKSVESYMPLWIADYLADTQHLSRDEHGGYLLLLMAYWRKGEALPDDDRKLAAIANASPAEWRKLRPVLAEFFQVADGVWTQKRIEAELARAKAIRARKTEAGSAGGRAKWAAQQTHADTRSQRLAAARAKGTHTKAEWLLLVGVCGDLCLRCGEPTAKFVKDHIVPIYKGGSDALSNLQPLCASCNSSKGPEETDYRPKDWGERLAKCLAELEQTPAISPSPSPFEPNGSNIDTSPAEPSVDLGAVAEAYNAVASDCGWPLCQALNAQRRASAKARLAEAGGIDGWRHAMAKARASPFLRGETGRSAGHENWRPDIDFFLKPKTFTKLMEGGYDGQQGHRTGTAPGRGKPAISPGWMAGALSAIETLESGGVAD